jgi:hypothetical protein
MGAFSFSGREIAARQNVHQMSACGLGVFAIRDSRM